MFTAEKYTHLLNVLQIGLSPFHAYKLRPMPWRPKSWKLSSGMCFSLFFAKMGDRNAIYRDILHEPSVAESNSWWFLLCWNVLQKRFLLKKLVSFLTAQKNSFMIFFIFISCSIMGCAELVKIKPVYVIWKMIVNLTTSVYNEERDFPSDMMHIYILTVISSEISCLESFSYKIFKWLPHYA